MCRQMITLLSCVESSITIQFQKVNDMKSLLVNLKNHTETLIKDIGVEAASDLTGKSKASLGRYYSEHDEHLERFITVDSVALLEQEASFPFVTLALAELSGATLSFEEYRTNTAKQKTVNSDVVSLSQRFAMLMCEYHQSIEDGSISKAESKRLFKEAVALQKVLTDMKISLEKLHTK